MKLTVILILTKIQELVQYHVNQVPQTKTHCKKFKLLMAVKHLEPITNNKKIVVNLGNYKSINKTIMILAELLLILQLLQMENN